MAVDISLSTNMRQTLNSIKLVRRNINNTTIRINTGKAVNSPADNVSAYIRSEYMNYRANELNSLLETSSQAMQTLKTATNTLSTITDTLEYAKAFAELAYDMNVSDSVINSDNSFDGLTQDITTITSVDAGDVIKIKTGDASVLSTSGKNFTPSQSISSAGITTDTPLYLKVGDNAWVSITPSSDNMSIEQYLDKVVSTIGEDLISAKIEDGNIVFTAKNNERLLTDDNPNGLVPAPNTATTLGLDTGTNITINAGMTLEELINDINNVAGVEATLSGKKLIIKNTQGYDIAISDLQGSSAKGLDIAKTSTNGTTSNATYANNFNTLIKQIDDLVNDSYYDGMNLLTGQNYKIYFDENRENSFSLRGVKADKESLGLFDADNEWKTKEDVEKSLNEINKALSKIEYYTEVYTNNMSSITSRSDYMGTIKDFITTVSEDIVMADKEEEAAKLLALQTQNELCLQALSLSSQANQNILKLFG